MYEKAYDPRLRKKRNKQKQWAETVTLIHPKLST